MQKTLTELIKQWGQLKHDANKIIMRMPDRDIDMLTRNDRKAKKIKVMVDGNEEEQEEQEDPEVAKKFRKEYRKVMIDDIERMYKEFDQGLSSKLKKLNNAADTRQKYASLREVLPVAQQYMTKVRNKRLEDSVEKLYLSRLGLIEKYCKETLKTMGIVP